MYEAEISVVICGLDNYRWIACAFDDTGFDEKDLEDEECSPVEVIEDPIVSSGDVIVDASIPTWDPREYYLMALNVHVIRVMKEFEYLVRKLERSIRQYVRLSLLISSGDEGH
jgi:hypothetical protein